jgi:hypothetical protein
MDDKDLYKNTDNIRKPDFGSRSDLKNVYFDFFKDFRNNLIDFVQESMSELVVSEISVGASPVSINNDNGCSGRYVTVKNQGNASCYLSTGNMGGFRLEPGEKEKFYLNKMVTVTTISGNTILGLIQS